MTEPKVIRINGTVYHRADTIDGTDVSEVVKSILGAAGITVEQICALADQLKSVCKEKSEEG